MLMLFNATIYEIIKATKTGLESLIMHARESIYAHNIKTIAN